MRLEFGGKDQRECAILITFYQGYIVSIWHITWCLVYLGHLVELFIRVLHFKLTLPSIVIIEKDVTIQPTLKERTLMLLFPEGKLYELFGILLQKRFVSSPTFTYSIIYISMDSWVFILWVIMHSYYLLSHNVGCNNCGLFCCSKISAGTSSCWSVFWKGFILESRCDWVGW